MTREFDLSDVSDSQVVLLWGIGPFWFLIPYTLISPQSYCNRPTYYLFILSTIRFFIKSPQEGRRSLTVRNIALNQIL